MDDRPLGKAHLIWGEWEPEDLAALLDDRAAARHEHAIEAARDAAADRAERRARADRPDVDP